MKLKLQTLLVLAGLVAYSIIAQELKADTSASAAVDQQKVSYALGMRAALQSKRGGGDLDAKEYAQGVRDVLDGKPTKVPQADLAKLLNDGLTGGGVSKEVTKDKLKVSYALGMRLGLQLKHNGEDADVNTVARAINDVRDGKPTLVQESEIEGLFQLADNAALAKLSQSAAGEGEAFLAKNAKEPGIIVLPDGLQYRVLQEGTGPIPSTNDIIYVNVRGTFINGTQFEKKDHFLTKSDGGPKGWQDALQRMKIGSKWQLYVPSSLAFGHMGDSYKHIGADTTLIYELELASIAPPNSSTAAAGRTHGLFSGNKVQSGVVTDVGTTAPVKAQ